MTDDAIPVDPEIDEIVSSLIGDLGSTVAAGAGLGSKWAARRMKTETASARIAVAPERRPAVSEAIQRLPYERWTSPDPSTEPAGEEAATRFVVGAGVGSMNPAFVTLAWTEDALLIAAYAKEGLIKQRTAQGAVGKLREALGL